MGKGISSVGEDRKEIDEASGRNKFPALFEVLNKVVCVCSKVNNLAGYRTDI